jgi:hypothetical protein
MQNSTHSFMGGYGGLGMVLGVLLAILLVVAIIKMVDKK